MNTWRMRNWETFRGTWLITSATLNDLEIFKIIKANPKKYGPTQYWQKIR